MRAALAALPDDVEDLFVLSGDVPLVLGDQLVAVIEQRRLDDAAIALASVFAADPGELGRVVRSEFGSVERIVEARDASADELETNEVNAGMYAFDAAWLRRRIGSLTPSRVERRAVPHGPRPAGARGRPDRQRRRHSRTTARSTASTTGASSPRRSGRSGSGSTRRHMRAGVTMRDPSTVYVDWSVRLAQDVVLEPGVVLRGSTSIGEGSTIGPSTTIEDSTIGTGCRVTRSVVEGSTVEDGATVGPYSHLRTGSHVGANAEIGNYAEIKNSRLGARVKQHHMSYLGDAEIGAGTNVGAGTITANWDGRTKHRTTIGEGAFLGVDTMLVAPVDVGAGAKTGAGAVVTRDIPAGKLAVGVPARIREPRRPARSLSPPNAEATRMSSPFGEILFLAFLTLLEGFFVAAEIALVSVRRSRIDQLVEEGNPSATPGAQAPGRSRPVPGRRPDRPDHDRLLRVGLRRRQPRRRACSGCSRASAWRPARPAEPRSSS